MRPMNTGPDAAFVAYWLAIEEKLQQLRGRPTMLTPADHHLVSQWHLKGIPLDLVRQTLEDVAARHRERGQPGVISSLRYFAAAVADAWSVRQPRD